MIGLCNLLKETVEALTKNGKTPDNVRWIGNGDIWFSWKDFKRVENVDYDNGYGLPYVPLDLVVVGNNWWLERKEYDGAERWAFKTMPKKPNKYLVPKNIINTDDDEYELSELIKHNGDSK